MKDIKKETMEKVEELNKRKATTSELLERSEGLVNNLLLLALAPVVLKDFKDVDHEFYYESKKRFKDMAESMEKCAAMLKDMVSKV